MNRLELCEICGLTPAVIVWSGSVGVPERNFCRSCEPPEMAPDGQGEACVVVPAHELGTSSEELLELLDQISELHHDLWVLRDDCILEGGPGDPTDGVLPGRCQAAMNALDSVCETIRDVLKAREAR